MRKKNCFSGLRGVLIFVLPAVFGGSHNRQETGQLNWHLIYEKETYAILSPLKDPPLESDQNICLRSVSITEMS